MFISETIEEFVKNHKDVYILKQVGNVVELSPWELKVSQDVRVRRVNPYVRAEDMDNSAQPERKLNALDRTMREFEKQFRKETGFVPAEHTHAERRGSHIGLPQLIYHVDYGIISLRPDIHEMTTEFRETVGNQAKAVKVIQSDLGFERIKASGNFIVVIDYKER